MREADELEILDVFRTSAQIVLGRSLREVSPGTRISDAGIDSMSRLEIVGLIEDHFNVRVDDDALMEVETIEDLVQVVSSARASEAVGSPPLEGRPASND